MPEPRFLTLDQVAEELATSGAQIYALVRRGDLAAIKLGGREQWRVERSALEEYLDRLRAATAALGRGASVHRVPIAVRSRG